MNYAHEQFIFSLKPCFYEKAMKRAKKNESWIHWKQVSSLEFKWIPCILYVKTDIGKGRIVFELHMSKLTLISLFISQRDTFFIRLPRGKLRQRFLSFSCYLNYIKIWGFSYQVNQNFGKIRPWSLRFGPKRTILVKVEGRIQALVKPTNYQQVFPQKNPAKLIKLFTATRPLKFWINFIISICLSTNIGTLLIKKKNKEKVQSLR